MVYWSDFAQAFIRSISKIMTGYKEGIVIFDRPVYWKPIEISDTQ